MKPIAPTPRTRLKRRPNRGSFDRTVINAILDEALVCHIGFVAEGQPFVLPTTYARVEDRLYIHGAAASRMLAALQSGVPVCVTVTLLDGLVLARSALHHSMNYRSVVILGTATEVVDPEEKKSALAALINHVLPGRTDDIRGPNEQELQATMVVSLPIAEASAKVRTGPPLDHDEDLSVPCWAGVIPLRMVAGAPVADPALAPEVAVPQAVARYTRGNGKPPGAE